MAYLKEKLNAFLDQPIERKRSDHRLKKVDSSIDPRSWALNEDLKRQQFLNVVNQPGDGGGGEEGMEEGGQFGAAMILGEPSQIEEKIKKLEEEKDFFRNVIADKENEIEQLIHRIDLMSEMIDSGSRPDETFNLKKQLNDLKNQLSAKDKELQKTQDLLNKAEGMVQSLQTLMQSTGEEPDKQKAQLDNIMRGLQAGLQDEIKILQDKVETLEDKLKDAHDENLSLKKELEALASGDDNALNKIILGLRNEVDNLKSSKEAQNKELKDLIAEKDNELKQIKDAFNLHEFQPTDRKDELKSQLPDNNNMKDLVDQKDIEIKVLKDQLENEKMKNEVLKDQLSNLASSDDDGLKKKILDLTAELNDLKSKPLEDKELLKEKPDDKLTKPADNQLKEIQDLLAKEKDQNEKLKQELVDARKKFDQIASADDNELRKLLADAEKEIADLKDEHELKDKLIDSLKSEILAYKEKSDPGAYKGEDLKQPREDNLVEENNRLKKEIDKLNTQIKALKGQIPENELLNELNRLQTENEALKSANKDNNKDEPEKEFFKPNKNEEVSLFDKSKQPDDKIDNTSDQLKKLAAENEGLKNENEFLKKALKDKANEAIQSQSDIPDNFQIKSDKDLLKLENDNLRKENRNLADEIESLKLRNNNLEDELMKVKAGIQTEVSKTEPDKSKFDPKNQVDETVPSSDQYLEGLKQKLNQLEDENNKLKNSAKEEKEKCNENLLDKDKLIGQLKSEIADLKNKPVSISADDGKKTKYDTEQPIPKEKDLKTDSDAKDQELTKMLNENKQLNNLNEKLVKDNDKLKKEVNDLKSALEETKPESEVSGSDKEVLKENKKLKDKIQLLEEKLQEAQTKVKPGSEIKEKDDKLNIDPLSKDFNKVLQENKDLKDKNKALEEKVKDLQSQISNVQGQDASKNKEYMETDLDKSGKDYGKLLDENNKLKDGIKGLENKVKDLESKIASPNKLEAEKKEKDIEFDSNKEDVGKTLEENKNLKDYIKKLENEIKDLKSKIPNIISKETGKNVKEDKPETNKTDNLLVEENAKLKDKIKKLEDELNGLKSQIAADRKEKIEPSGIEKDKKQGFDDNARDVEKLLREENAKLKEKLRLQDNELNKDSEKKDPLSGKVEKGKNNEELLNENKNLQGKIKSLENEIKDLKLKTTDKAGKPSLDKEENKDLKKLQDDKLKLAKENEVLNSNLKDLNKQLNDLKAQKNGLEEENNKLTELVKLAEEAGGLTNDDVLKLYKENNEKLKKENSMQRERIDQLEKELNELKGVIKKGGEKSQAVVKGTKVSPAEEIKNKQPLDEKERPQKETKEKQEKDDKSKPGLKLDKKERDESNAFDPTVEKEKGKLIKDGTPLMNKNEQSQPVKDKVPPTLDNNNVQSMLQQGVDRKNEEPKPKVKFQPDGEAKKDQGKGQLYSDALKEKVDTDKPDQFGSNKEKNKENLKVLPTKMEREPIKKNVPDQAKTDKVTVRPKSDESEDKETRKKRETSKSTNLSPRTDDEKPRSDETEDKVTRKKRETSKSNILSPRTEDEKPKSDETEDKVTRKKRETSKSNILSPRTEDEKQLDRSKSPKTTTREQKLTSPKEDSLEKKPKPVTFGKEKEPPEEKAVNLKKEGKALTSEEPKKVTPQKSKIDKQSKPLEAADDDFTRQPQKTTKTGEGFVETKLPQKKGKTKQTEEKPLKENIKPKEKYIDEDKTTDFEDKTLFKDKENIKGDLSKKKPTTKMGQGDKSIIDADQTEKLVKGQKTKPDKEETWTEDDFKDRLVGDKDYDNLINELTKKLNEAEKLIDKLNKENFKLNQEMNDLKMKYPVKEEKPQKNLDLIKHVDDNTSKLNKILEKAIRYGLKSLYLNELRFVHDSLNNRMLELKGRPGTPSHIPTEELQNIINTLNLKNASLMHRLDMYRQQSGDNGRKLSDYSQRVQELITMIGVKDMKLETLQRESNLLRNLLSCEKEKSKKLEDMLKSVLKNCKCTNKLVLQQNYSGIR